MSHPFIPLYVDDFEGATAHLNLEEDGLYNRLMRLCWRTPGCSLPTDHAWIARKVRVSVDDFERIGGPLLGEFFRVQRGRYVQKRLKDEYDDISRKKSARQKAGKTGGLAKAAKTKDIEPSIARDLPADTGAFQNQNQNHMEEATASSPAEPAKAKSRRKPETTIPDGFPDAEGLDDARNRAQADGADLNATQQAEKFRNHALQVDRRARDWRAAWRNWIIRAIEEAPKRAPQAALLAAIPKFPNAAIRDYVAKEHGEPFAVSYLDTCGYAEEGEAKTITAPNSYIAKKLTDDVKALAKRNIRIVIAQPAGKDAA